jgi:hypothetical protein
MTNPGSVMAPGTAGISCHNPPSSVNQDRRVRAIAVPHNAQQRQHHREHDSLFHAHQNHHAHGDHRQRPFARTLAANAVHAAQVTSRMATMNTIAPSTHFGRYCNGWVRKSSTNATTPPWQRAPPGSLRLSFPPWRFAWGCHSPRTSRSAPPPRSPPPGPPGPCSRPALMVAHGVDARRGRALRHESSQSTMPPQASAHPHPSSSSGAGPDAAIRRPPAQ